MEQHRRFIRHVLNNPLKNDNTTLAYNLANVTLHDVRDRSVAESAGFLASEILAGTILQRNGNVQRRQG